MLQILEESVSELRVFSLSGKFDFYGVQAFKAAMKKAEKDPINHLIIDLSLVPSIDSASLGALVAAQKRFSRTNTPIWLVIDPNSVVGQVMNHASIQSLMPIFHSKREALSSLLSSATQP